MVNVRIGVKVVDPGGVEGTGPADDAVHFIPFLEQQIREVRSVLTRYSSNESFLHEVIGD